MPPQSHNDVKDRLAHSFAILHFDQKGFDPKHPEPLNEHFRLIAYKMHPDRHPGEQKKEADAAFGQVTAAFHFIMDNLEQIKAPAEPAPASSSGQDAVGCAKASETVRSELDGMAKEGKWDELAGAVAGLRPDDALSVHATSLMEKGYKQVISSGQPRAISYLCRRTLLSSIIACALRSADDAGAATLIGIMAERGMWKELKDNILLGRGPKSRSLSVMEDNEERILREGGEDVITFLWENATREGLREDIIGKLASSERPDSVKPILERMAKRKMSKSLAYSADSIFPSNPKLRRYALMLREIALADAYLKGAPMRHDTRPVCGYAHA